jgi:hypothetical protein
MGELVALPANDSSNAAEAVDRMARAGWRQAIGIGVTADGRLEIVNSAMSAERALWLTEWARRWALGLTEGDS